MSAGAGYRLELSLRVVEDSADGYRQGNGLEVRDQVMLPPMGFLEVAAVLGRFHELAETLKAAHAAGEVKS